MVDAPSSLSSANPHKRLHLFINEKPFSSSSFDLLINWPTGLATKHLQQWGIADHYHRCRNISVFSSTSTMPLLHSSSSITTGVLGGLDLLLPIAAAYIHLSIKCDHYAQFASVRFSTADLSLCPWFSYTSIFHT
ncbi:hypothetical protein B296_00035722 [Ensete ventricosum]|uniref:Uncharacterized protein n=1 Tax=Ensete ventricosum TaxID=4639 RepID=A0A426Y6X3_ENSVE|nr:hypothetical protein B296_00035722 [Ensete ventricosum]